MEPQAFFQELAGGPAIVRALIGDLPAEALHGCTLGAVSEIVCPLPRGGIGHLYLGQMRTFQLWVDKLRLLLDK